MRLFLLRRLLPGPFAGILPGTWFRLLQENRFAVDPAYWPRALLITAMSLNNAVLSGLERRAYGARYASVRVQPPVFILGYYRSGTTLLHQLLSRDPRFAAPNTYQTFFPHTFLTTEAFQKRSLGALLPRTRVFDNVAFGFDVPQEDEFALCVMTLQSHLLGYSFPKRCAAYERYLTFAGAPAAALAAWQDSFLTFLKKLTWACGNRPLILKSPPHTARIRVLLDLFPQARFVHIHRCPFTVFQSTRHMLETGLQATALQRAASLDLDAHILRAYRVMYDAFFEAQPEIPPGQFHELAFADLEADPVAQLERLYAELRLPALAEVLPDLAPYAASLAGYRKNTYPPLPAPLKARIRAAWHRSFKAWGYDDA